LVCSVDSRNQSVARRIARDLLAYTGGDTSRWVMVHSIARRLVLRDQEEVDRAMAFAREHGWVELQGMHRIKLTDEGRRLFGTARKG
jgi:predicted transcriptional regulator